MYTTLTQNSTPAQPPKAPGGLPYFGHQIAFGRDPLTFLDQTLPLGDVAEIQQALGDRQPTLADLPALASAERVIKESMRLYPPLWSIAGRLILEDCEISGYTADNPYPRQGRVVDQPKVACSGLHSILQ